jgi:hypothetical protein
MNCQAVQDLLPAYLIENLDPAKNQAVKNHLAGCAGCQAYLANLKAAGGRFQQVIGQQMTQMTPPANAWARIQTRLAFPERKTAVGSRFYRVAFAAAALLLLSFLFAPAVYAQLGKIAGGWLRIPVPSSGSAVTINNFQAFTPLIPSSLPAGFDLTTTGIHSGPGGDELQLTYAEGKNVFLLVQKQQAGAASPVEGSPVDLGKFKGNLLDPAGKVAEQYRANITSGEIRLLTWNQEGILLSLYSNMPVEDMLQFARSLQPAQR